MRKKKDSERGAEQPPNLHREEKLLSLIREDEDSAELFLVALTAIFAFLPPPGPSQSPSPADQGSAAGTTQ